MAFRSRPVCFPVTVPTWPAPPGPPHLQVPLPPWALHVAPGVNADFDCGTLRLSASSPLHPPVVLDYNLASGALQALHTQAPTLHAANVLKGCSAVRLWARSYDGAQLPLTLLLPPGAQVAGHGAAGTAPHAQSPQQHDSPGAMAVEVLSHSPQRTDAGTTTQQQPAGPAQVHGGPWPCLALVYGAYGLPQELAYEPAMVLPLLARGWVVAYIHTRGGERGATWQQRL